VATHPHAAALVPVTKTLLRRWPLPALSSGADKEQRGDLLVLAGSTETPGAAVLAALAALRVGAGKLTIGAPAAVAPSIASSVPEARVLALPSSSNGGITAGALRVVRTAVARADAILVGPGMTDSPALRDLVQSVVARPKAPALVLDAAALHSVAKLQKLRRAHTPYAVITPHAGEMARLVGSARQAVESEPAGFARRLAREANVIVVLKGAVTIIAHPAGHAWKHVGDAIGLATSGSGDTLAGAIAGLAARGAVMEQAAAWGVAVHALAGKALTLRYKGPGLLAREIAGEMPGILNTLEAKAGRG